MNVESEWWRGHFSGLMTDLWRALLPPGQAATDSDFVEAAARLGVGSRVLDVPCGEGRVAIELAKRGHRVTGIDISADLLAHAVRQSGSLQVEWIEGDMRRLPWHREFDCIACLGDSFGYMDDGGNAEFLDAARAALKDEGTLVLDMKMLAEVLFPSYREEAAGKVGEISLKVKRAFDPASGRLSVEYSLRRGEEQARRLASYRIYTCAQIMRMLTAAGFREVRFEDGSGAAFRLGSDRLRVIAHPGA